MRRLILMRHGEAVAADLEQRDKDRALTPLGIGASVRCAQELRARGFSPDLILCSDAVRAAQTLDAVTRGGDFSGIQTKTLSLLYLADPETLLLRCCEVGEAIETLMLIGHNPGWSEAASYLSGSPLSLGTAQAALLEHTGQEWVEALHSPGSWRLRAIIP